MTVQRDSRAARIGGAALGVPAFRTFFLATLVSNTATFMLSAGISWAALETSGSPGGVALVGFLFALPFTLLTLHAGLVADWFGARPVLALSLALSGGATLLLGCIALGWGLPYAAIAGAAVLIGTLSVLGSPAGMTIANEIVTPGLVPSAMTLIWITVNFGRVAGGLIAGALLAHLAGGWTLAVAGALTIAVALVIRRLPVPRPVRAAHVSVALLAPLREATGHAFREPTMRTLLAIAVVAGSLGLGFNYQLPLAATELGAGANGYGTLVAAVGLGGLVAGLLAERLMRRLGQGRVILVGVAAVAAGLVACGLSPALLPATLGIGLAGGGFAIYGATTLALLQALTPPDLRGRTTALFSLLYWGLMPVGAVIGGVVASTIGARGTLIVMGLSVGIAGIAAVVVRPGLTRMRVGADGSISGREATTG